ncbi:MAG: beta-glucosidase [Candidatus Eisenbacteria bacterium]|uniref:Beta-glucosidase n=1 Tax=Eiseniibacteriota bacterium TaxID=2212470 RepID=A0A538TH51_UNCEI|nr:MAG: beta-glucosidase [Candidatus Eisenbacteria bacterium]
MTEQTTFPQGFLWGAATSAYQIEGSPLADGAGPSIWHRFSHTPGRTHLGQTGDVACDHYRRWAEDVELMHGLGLGAYRLSLSWSRLLPEGRGAVNPKGLDFYSRLVDRLLERRIQPMVTLYHWDLPAALDDRGGWLNRDVVDWFADYARVAFEALGDRVTLWATINEPWVITDAGYLFGVNAPGHRNLFEAPIAFHHLLRAHAAAVRAYRANGRGKIGLVVNLEPKVPASDRPEDVAAAARDDRYNNLYHLDPVFFGRYPDGMQDVFGEGWPAFAPEDVARIREPIDFVGVNYYTQRVVRHDAKAPLGFSSQSVPGALTMETGWQVVPAGLTRALLWVGERYGKVPVYVTENGAAFADPARAPEGRLDDPLRVRYYRDHLLAVRDAIQQGVDVRGYFAWSLLDNFEWSRGYSLRFGLVHVDFDTQRRTVKASGNYYREVIATHGGVLAEPVSAAP